MEDDISNTNTLVSDFANVIIVRLNLYAFQESATWIKIQSLRTDNINQLENKLKLF